MQPRRRPLPQRPAPPCSTPHTPVEPLDEDLALQRAAAAARLGRRPPGGYRSLMLAGGGGGDDPVDPADPAAPPAPVAPAPGAAPPTAPTIQLPAGARDSINFCVASVNRNRFLQGPTGLFGGDDAALSTYSPADPHYRQSDAYSRAVSVWRPQTNVPLYAREPLPCWYGAGVLTLREAPTAAGVLRAPWTVPDGLWTTLRVPGQVVTLVARGRCCHCPVLPETTAAALACQLPATDPAGGAGPAAALFAAGDAVPYLLRARAPNVTVLGPVVAVGTPPP